ncbi:hypothetical protein ACLOJK_025112 [Asimina triloba]
MRVMEFQTSIGLRVRYRRAINWGSTSGTKRKRKTDAAGAGVRRRRKQESPEIVCLDEEDDEKVSTPAAVNSVAGRTRSRRYGMVPPKSSVRKASKNPVSIDSEGSECSFSPSSSSLGDNGVNDYSTYAVANNGDDGDHDDSDDAAKNDENGESPCYVDDRIGSDNGGGGGGSVGEQSGSCCGGLKKEQVSGPADDETGGLGPAVSKNSGIAKRGHDDTETGSVGGEDLKNRVIALNQVPLVPGDNETGSSGRSGSKNTNIFPRTRSHLSRVPLLPDDHETGNLGRADSKNRSIAQLTRSRLNRIPLVPGDNKTGSLGGADSKNSNIAYRTRSHLLRNRVPKEKFGTFTDPIDLDHEADCPQSAPAAAKSYDFLNDGNDGDEDSDDDSDSDENDNTDSSSSDEEHVVNEDGGDRVIGDAVGGDDSSHKEYAVSEDGGDCVINDAVGGDGDGSNMEYVFSEDRGDHVGDDAKHDNGNDDINKEYVVGEDGGDHFTDDADGKGEDVAGNTKGEKVQFGKFTKRKSHQDNYRLKLLLDTIWSKEQKLPEELSTRGELPTKSVKEPKSLKRFPLKFSWDDDKVPEVEEKTVEEKFIDKLWTEFDFAMKSRDLSCFSPSEMQVTVVDNEVRNAPEFERDQFNFCRRGEHQFILDEEIGIKCILCPFIKLEIRYILPPMINSWGKSNRHGSAADGNSLFHKFHCQGVNADSQCSVPSEGTVWDIIPGVKSTMYAHQQEGFEFIWKNLAGSIKLEQLKESTHCDDVGGCVISHAPGTGKTRLAIVFIQTFMEVFPECRPIILAPASMLVTWEKEFSKWKVDIPIHILNRKGFSGKEDKAALGLGHDKCRNLVRLVKIFSWNKGKGILGLTYNLFEKLVGKSFKHDKGLEIGKILTEKTGLLVLDEGHTPRNARSRIWKALKQVKTNRRIILSGTPFQNNFLELYNTLCLVRPQFANNFTVKHGYLYQSRSEKLFDNVQKVLLERRDGRKKWVSLTSTIGKGMNANLEKLRSLMDPFVHVYKGSILNQLPGLRDCILVLHPPPLQKSILESFTNSDFGNNFYQEYCTALISVHPSLLIDCKISEKDGIIIERDQLEKLRLNPDAGVKTKFVIEFIRLCDAMNEKVLIFSQYLSPLILLKDQLKHLFDWSEGKEVLQMDGDITDINRRQSCIDCFNDPTSEARVLLASIRACGEGINLIGASRVVLLDVVWNPSVERQAISRAYRIGQEKMVYSYHLLTSGTREGDKYYRQAEKDRLSELLFSSTDVDTYKQDSSKISKDRILEEMVEHEKLKAIFEKILHQPRKSSILNCLGPAAFI